MYKPYSAVLQQNISCKYKMKRYVVVEFTDDHSVDIVPSLWLTDDNCCYWPPYRKERLGNAIKRCESSCDSWLKCSIRVLHSCGKCRVYYSSTSYTEHRHRTFLL